MAENDFVESLSETVSRLMESPEVADIIASMGVPANDGEKNEVGERPPAGGIEIPPDIMEKLPSMISALSGMGIGSGGAVRKAEQQSSPNEKPRRAGDKQRKALLSSLRPYLNPHRQNIIDNMLRIEGFAGLLGSVSASAGTNTDNERR